MITRRQLLNCVGAVMVGAWASECGAQTSSAGGVIAKPNIIYILVDDLGYGDLGCYGQAQIKTPNIDRMAAEGMRFTDHYAGSTVCAPSRCCLMTGLHTGLQGQSGAASSVSIRTHERRAKRGVVYNR